MDIEITKPISGGVVKSVASKSHAHRLLVCAALATGESYVKCAEIPDDIGATVACLRELGADINHDGAGFTIKPIELPVRCEPIIMNCGESGSTLRFLLPVCCVLDVSAEFVLRGSLKRRPISPLLDQLSAHGCSFEFLSYDVAPWEQEGSPSGGANGAQKPEPLSAIRCLGKLDGGMYEISGDVSSQFISGLMLALPLSESDSVIVVKGREESRPYIAMTLDVLDAFGASVEHVKPLSDWGSVYKIYKSGLYVTPGTISVEGDWTHAATWLSAGAIGSGAVTCTGLNLGSNQGDMAIVRLLERFGANVAYEGDSVTVKPGKLCGLQIDASDIPDIVPILSLVAAVAEGETLIYNAGRLRLKESDRLHTVAETLRALGADITETWDELRIRGKKALNGGTVSSFGDHRITMMAAIASTACTNPVAITGVEAVNKSYPGFFIDFSELGGEFH